MRIREGWIIDYSQGIFQQLTQGQPREYAPAKTKLALLAVRNNISHTGGTHHSLITRTPRFLLLKKIIISCNEPSKRLQYYFTLIFCTGRLLCRTYYCMPQIMKNPSLFHFCSLSSHSRGSQVFTYCLQQLTKQKA